MKTTEMNRMTKDFPKYLSGYIMEECLDHIVTHAPYIWMDPILPSLTKSILVKFREFVIFVFKPKLA